MIPVNNVSSSSILIENNKPSSMVAMNNVGSSLNRPSSMMATNNVASSWILKNYNPTSLIAMKDYPSSLKNKNNPSFVMPAMNKFPSSPIFDNSNQSSVMAMNNNDRKRKACEVEIKKMENVVGKRQVTFSERLKVLFKEASELCITTGAELGIVIQTELNRFYTFGHPSIDDVTDRCMNGSSATSSNTTNSTIAAVQMREHEMEYDRLVMKLEEEKKKVEQMEKANPNNALWWEEPIDHMGLEELEVFASALEKLSKNVETKVTELDVLKKQSNSINPCDDDDYIYGGLGDLPLVLSSKSINPFGYNIYESLAKAMGAGVPYDDDFIYTGNNNLEEYFPSFLKQLQ
ncbi:OLC1v1020569C1 [Oldenlandia corymbosa var. corymbosa]|uniref:OLC1v1020569C1 n=1 Tax=Oldenlandia corymbosa var. corymbosa TaxID=529605 RepID=A0AAV1EGR4_OLDCO|nr:OLC1v1020569C1 [Oldenlandia corymbosa var. corymbosa]